jgi:RNA polymerase sigma-70 factor (ECF subfamily)
MGEPSDKLDSEGDRAEAYVRLLMEHEPKIRSFLRGLLPGWNDVDEVIQEASLIAWRKFDQFELGTAFGGWFLTIARFEALKHRRKLARSPQVFSEEVWTLLADDAVDEEAPLARKHLEKCLEQMDSERRDIMLKVHSPGVVIRDVAKQSGRSEAAFYKLIQRLRIVLLDCISRSVARENE